MEILCEVSMLDLRAGDIVLWEPNYPVFVVHPYIQGDDTPEYGRIVLREQKDRGIEFTESAWRYAEYTVMRPDAVTEVEDDHETENPWGEQQSQINYLESRYDDDFQGENSYYG